MIDRAHDLPITKQAEALNISRGSVYYLPRPVPKADLAIMRRLDRLHLEFPFAGSRMLRDLLVVEGCMIGRRHVKTLIRPSPACSPTTASPSAWTARAPGGTTSSSSGSGAASNTRRYILEPTTASARLACRSAATWTFITAGDRIRALTARHPIKPISASCRSAWQPNLGRRSTYRCANSGFLS